MSLKTEQLSISYGSVSVLDDLNVTIPKNAVTAIIGPNGCGKSTLLRGLAGLLPAKSGHVLLDGEVVARLRPANLAKRMAFLPQSSLAPDGIRVGELVGRGRIPWLRPFRALSDADHLAVSQAMEATGIEGLRNRPVGDLSGGQRQRVWIAMALAQNTEWLLLDEPTTWLDLTYQLDLLKLLRRLNREDNRSIVMVLHDISQAARIADHIIALRDGRVMAEGSPSDVIQNTMLEAVFGLQAQVIPDPLHGTPLVLPY